MLILHMLIADRVFVGKNKKLDYFFKPNLNGRERIGRRAADINF
jgi:hypothetical protein